MIKISIGGDAENEAKDFFGSLISQTTITFLEAFPHESVKVNVRKKRQKREVIVDIINAT